MLAGYLLLTTALGARLAGRQATIRDFFLGGRRLPWPAVTGSIIATEISAVTFIGVPAIVFAPGGDLTYLQLAAGAVLARVIIGIWFVPAFYEREIYSPYDYMGDRLGPPVRSAASGLFMLGAILGQSVRVLLTAMVLRVITGLPLVAAIWIIGVLAVAWTLLGGMTTVIWTDVIQFLVFTLGLVAGLVYVCRLLPGGWAEILAGAASATDALGRPASKLRLLDLDPDPQKVFTVWTALIANTLLCLNAYGTDQLIAQRMFCCRGPGEARKAIIVSSAGQLLTVLALLTGLALHAFYQRFPLAAAQAARVGQNKDYIFPLFIIRQMPAGFSGLIIAGVFAAAISSLDSVLAALSQTVISGFYRPWRAGRRRPPARDRHYVRAARGLVVFWGAALCACAMLIELARQRYGDILNLALAMASYTGGALLAAFCLALFRLNVDQRGILWSAPLSVLTVFAISWHQWWAQLATAAAASAILLAWLLLARDRLAAHGRARAALDTGLVALAAAATVMLSSFNYLTDDLHYLTLAWPWNVPIGFAVAFTLGYLLARRRPARP